MLKPWLDDGDLKIFVGDCRDVLKELPDESVHCVVTSPPYWGLRDYGTGAWEGGDPSCDHSPEKRGGRFASPVSSKQASNTGSGTASSRNCSCGAVRVDSQLGMEPTPEEFVENMVEVFREVRRVLRSDGTCWLNLGDSYMGGGKGQGGSEKQQSNEGANIPSMVRSLPGIKPKNLVGIPWRVAFALQADGWYLRSDIIWAKKNAMPESVSDRPTKSHEFLFLLTKAPWQGRTPGIIESRLSIEDARWLALLVDAEGNICVKRVAPKDDKSPLYGAQISIGSTSRALLERAQMIIGAGNILERGGTNAPMYYWQVSNKIAQDLLYALYPHLIVKQRQARIAIHLESSLYHRGNATRRTPVENAALESLWERNKKCNQFGQPDLSDVPEPKYGSFGPTRYFYDQHAIMEPAEWDRWGDQTNHKHEGSESAASWIKSKTKEELQLRGTVGKGLNKDRGDLGRGGFYDGKGWRNARSVWSFSTQSYEGAHFATFPEELPRRCIKAGTSEKGCCPECKAPWVRVLTEPSGGTTGSDWNKRDVGDENVHRKGGQKLYGTYVPRQTMGWEPSCSCGHPNPLPCTVLDPFGGAGTTAKVARDLGRKSVLIELSEPYASLAADRLQQLSLLS